MDIKSAFDQAQNNVNHKRSKYIGIKSNWIHEQVASNIIRLNHVQMLTADMMMKTLPEKLHHQHVNTVIVC